MSWDKDRVFEILTGKTLSAVSKRDDEIIFECTDGTKYKQYHHQDCCENVYVEDVVGELNDLIGEVIIDASERCNDDPEASESGTWTFYHISTLKTSVTIRWYGQSNGYYSEGVAFVEIT